MSDNTERDPRLHAIPDVHGHAKGEHKAYADERPLPLTARMLFLWFYHACKRGYPRFLMVADHMNYLTFEDPAAVNLVRRALKLAQAGDLYGAAETANVDVGHAAVVSEGLRRGLRYSIGAEVDNDPRSRPDAQNIVDAMRPDGMIRSVHFVPINHPTLGENWNWPFDNPEFKELYDVVGTEQLWESYTALLVDAIERLPGHIVGHFFVPAVFGHWPDDAKLSAYEDRVLDAAAARGMAIEFNTRFLYRDHSDEEKQRYLAANKRLLRKAKDRGVGIAVGSDAHSPKDQGGAFEIVLQVLDELEINELVFPLAGQLRRVALRVVREPEPEPIPEPPKPPATAAVTEATHAPEEPPPPKPRKPRPTPKPARSPERAEPETAPVEAHPSGNGVSEAPAVVEAAPPPPAPAPAPVPAAKPQPEPAVAAKPSPKAPPKAVPAKKAAAPAKKSAPAKATAAKAGAKKSMAAKAKKATPARGAVKKAAPAKKAAKKSPAPKKAAPARRPAAKKAAPKKAAGKKSAPARSAPARKSTAAKKTTKKATKRR